jgi:hypothetical protein
MYMRDTDECGQMWFSSYEEGIVNYCFRILEPVFICSNREAGELIPGSKKYLNFS